MSRTLSTNSGSLESLNVSERCGWRPKAVQIRRMVVCEKPVAAAIERIDQWVASTGVELNGILGMAGLLLDTRLDPEQATYAEAVKASGETLLSLIDEILDFSRIEAGKLALAAE